MADDLADARLEREINQAQQVWLDSTLDKTKTPEQRAALYREFTTLIGRRSEAQIERMEREMGLL